ncbi:PDZ domain-containing protein [Filobacillus milosensis]|uniref:PDZ domain-containing protein n=1 Tax=Filobacillus milosensis TaxID=94137 RepID=A0A4Y8IHJ8_9BACI|nr:PDZ domain-containing protein [Filobacillus milosensis]TFB18543.1 PDZ domain-containing protein [Filobacillus milosensis]
MTNLVSVKRSIWVNTSLEKVWNALTREEDLLKWYTWECDLDFREGGKGFYNHGWGAYSSGTFEDIVELERFVLRSGENQRTITTLKPEKGGVTVTMVYEMPDMENMDFISENMAFGTDQFMKNLKSMLEENKDLRSTFWKSWIGVNHISAQNQGSKVLSVKEGTPADQAGLKKGDIILKVNGEDIQDFQQLESIITSTKTNETMNLKIRRGNETLEKNCMTVEFPNEYHKKVNV